MLAVFLTLILSFIRRKHELCFYYVNNRRSRGHSIFSYYKLDFFCVCIQSLKRNLRCFSDALSFLFHSTHLPCGLCSTDKKNNKKRRRQRRRKKEEEEEELVREATYRQLWLNLLDVRKVWRNAFFTPKF